MALVLDVDLYKGSLTEKVTNRPFTTNYTTGLFSKYNGLKGFNLAKGVSLNRNQAKINGYVLGSTYTMVVAFTTWCLPSETTQILTRRIGASLFAFYHVASKALLVQFRNSADTASNTIGSSNIIQVGLNIGIVTIDETNLKYKAFLNGVTNQGNLDVGYDYSPNLDDYWYIGYRTPANGAAKVNVNKVKIYDNILSDTEIDKQYQELLKLSSPQKPVYRNYQPKPNQLTDGLVINYTKRIGNNLIDNVSGLITIINTPEYKPYLEQLRDFIKTSKYFYSFNLLKPVSISDITIGIRCKTFSGDPVEIFYLNQSLHAFRYYIGQWKFYGATTIDISPVVSNKTIESTFLLTYSSVTNEVKVYQNNTLLQTTVIPAIGAITNINTMYFNGLIFKDISVWNKVLTAAAALAYHNQFSYVTLHETFENDAVGDVYGEPYLTNARPTVSELTTAQYGYEIGKKYLPSSGATAKFAYIKQDEAFGTYRNYHVFDSFTGVVQIVYVSANKNNATATTANGYYLEINGTNRTIAIKRSGATQLLISSNNVFAFGQPVKLEVTRTTTGVQTLIINDVAIGSTAADLTWLTSENMRIPTQYTSTFEIEQIVK